MSTTLGIAAAILALVLCHFHALSGMVNQWLTDEDMSHGFLVPLVVVAIVWNERRVWKSVPVKPNSWGWAAMVAGALAQWIGAAGGGLFLESAAFLLSVSGAVVCLAGFPRLRAWLFPLTLTLFMLPKLAVVYNQLTLPLQLTASQLAAWLLAGAGAAVIREGNILDIGGHRISVLEACDGIRYLLPLGFMALVIGYVSRANGWIRLALLAAAVPVAIVANAMRVAAAGYWPALTDGLPHAFTGWVLFAASLGILSVIRMFLRPWDKTSHA